MKNNKIHNKNGIELKREILSDFLKSDGGYTHIFKIFLVMLSSLCALYTFISATKMKINMPVFIAFDVVATLLICSFRHKTASVKYASAGIIAVIVAFFAFKYKEIIIGFKHILNDYMTAVDSEKLFDNLTGIDKAFNTNLAFLFLLFAVIFGLSFTLYYHFSFIGTFCLTFPFLELGLFWGFVPDYFSFFVLLCVWVISYCSQNCTGSKVKKSKKNVYLPKTDSKVFYCASNNQTFTNGAKASTFVAVLSAMVLIISIAVSSMFSARPEIISNTRFSIQNAVENFKVEEIPSYVDDIMENFSINTNSMSVAGLNHGNLGKDGKMTFKNKVMLEIDLSQMFSCDVLYLKGYSAGVYTGNSWEQLDSDIYNKDYKDLFENSEYGFQDYGNLFFNSSFVSEGNDNHRPQILIRDKHKSKNFYMPYSSFFRTIEDGYPVNDTYFRAKSNEYIIEFRNEISSSSSIPNYVIPYAYLGGIGFNQYIDFVYENYRDFDEDIIAETYDDFINSIIAKAKEGSYTYNESYPYPDFDSPFIEDYLSYLNDTNYDLSYDYDQFLGYESTFVMEYLMQFDDYSCKENGFIEFPNLIDGNIELVSVVGQLLQGYFAENYVYTLKPGKTPKDEDFVQYFLEEQKKGYCTYFASAGTLMMRALGFPARYAEGFVAPSSEFKADDEGVYSAKIKDKYAHAWCEVFVPQYGWVPVEFTPGYEDGMIDYIDSEVTTTTTTTTTASSKQTTTTTTSAKVETTSESVQCGTTNSEGKITTVTTTFDEKKSGEKADYGKITGIVVTTLLSVFAVLLILYLWKTVYERKRKKHNDLVSNSDRNKSVVEIYRQFVKILNAVGIHCETFKTDIQNTSVIYEELKRFNVTVNPEEFEEFVVLAVEADMSVNTVTESSYEFAKGIFQRISDEIYAGVSPIKRFTLKYFKFLY